MCKLDWGINMTLSDHYYKQKLILQVHSINDVDYIHLLLKAGQKAWEDLLPFTSKWVTLVRICRQKKSTVGLNLMVALIKLVISFSDLNYKLFLFISKNLEAT